MPAARIWIHLSERQRQRIGDIVRAQDVSLATLVRKALDFCLKQAPVDADEALRSTFGAAPGAEAPPREEWAARFRRVRGSRPASSGAA